MKYYFCSLQLILFLLTAQSRAMDLKQYNDYHRVIAAGDVSKVQHFLAVEYKEYREAANKEKEVLRGSGLVDAASRGHRDLVLLMLAQGVSQSSKDHALAAGAWNEKTGLEIAPILFKAGVTSEGIGKALRPAAIVNNLALVKLLLQTGVPTEYLNDAITIDAQQRHLQVIESLLKAGPSDWGKARGLANSVGPSHMLGGTSPLCIVEAFLEAGTPFFDGSSVSTKTNEFVAFCQGNEALLAYRKKHHPDLPNLGELYEQPGFCTFAADPLTYCKKEQLTQDQRVTCLRWAVLLKLKACIKALLERGSTKLITMRDVTGKSALHYATLMGDTELTLAFADLL